MSNIKSGKDLEKNLPEYLNQLMTFYNSYSTIGLTMHYYTFYEMNLDEEFHGCPDLLKSVAKINQLLSNFYNKNSNMENIEAKVEEINRMRNEVMKIMQILTAYTDIFQIYEYVLNRCELKFEEDLEDINEEVFVNEVLQYIVAEKENGIINMKLQDLVGQLPVRMTKAKFFDLLSDSLKL